MGRLPGFDYKRPFFYMVTLKRAAACGPEAPQFSRLEPGGALADTPLTPALRAVVEHFHETWWCIEPIRHYVIMPDHLHMIVKMRAVEGRVSLAVVVRQLLKALEKATADNEALQNRVLQGALRPPVFAPDWHDWIVKKEGQLAAFKHYIAENGPRAWLRRENRRFFTKAREIVFQGRRCRAYGNEALLDLPVIVAIKGHRAPKDARSAPGKTGFSAGALRLAASRIGPGGAGLSTFLSPLEKEAGNEIAKAGGALIVLSVQGFADRWHPSEKQERLCAAGRMLYLSPYAPQAAKLTRKEMFTRAHALVDWAREHSHHHVEAWPDPAQPPPAAAFQLAQCYADAEAQLAAARSRS